MAVASVYTSSYSKELNNQRLEETKWHREHLSYWMAYESLLKASIASSTKKVGEVRNESI